MFRIQIEVLKKKYNQNYEINNFLREDLAHKKM